MAPRKIYQAPVISGEGKKKVVREVTAAEAIIEQAIRMGVPAEELPSVDEIEVALPMGLPKKQKNRINRERE